MDWELIMAGLLEVMGLESNEQKLLDNLFVYICSNHHFLFLFLFVFVCLFSLSIFVRSRMICCYRGKYYGFIVSPDILF